jgi:hypothetical protein
VTAGRESRADPSSADRGGTDVEIEHANSGMAGMALTMAPDLAEV